MTGGGEEKHAYKVILNNEDGLIAASGDITSGGDGAIGSEVILLHKKQRKFFRFGSFIGTPLGGSVRQATGNRVPNATD